MSDWQALAKNQFPELRDKLDHIESRTDLYLGLHGLLQNAFATGDQATIGKIVEFMVNGLRQSAADEGWLHSTKHVLRAISNRHRSELLFSRI